MRTAHSYRAATDLPGLDGDVGRLSPRHAARLVKHDACVGQGRPVPLFPRGQQHCPKPERLTSHKGAALIKKTRMNGRGNRRLLRRRVGQDEGTRDIEECLVQATVLLGVKTTTTPRTAPQTVQPVQPTTTTS